MPYIPQQDRKYYEEALEGLIRKLRNDGWKKGDFNYCVSTLLRIWVGDMGLCYNTLSDITGVLSDIKTEFERQVVGPYEDKKLIKNGSVYNDL